MRRDETAHEPELAAWRQLYGQSMGVGSESCPDDEILAALALGELSAEERQGLADHVVTCRRCAASLETLLGLEDEVRRGRAALRPWRLVPLVAAASLVAGLGIAVTWRALRAPDGDALRSTASETEASPAGDVLLAAAPTELRWTAQPGASGYRVRLFDARGEPLWEEAFAGGVTAALPAEVRSQVPPGNAFFWVVEVEGLVAETRLGPYWFRVRGPH